LSEDGRHEGEGFIGHDIIPRAFIIEMRRKKSGEQIPHFKHIDDDGLSELRSKCFCWAMDNGETLKTAEQQMPPGFDNRLGDNWRLMFAIADSIGDGWSERTRQAAIPCRGHRMTTPCLPVSNY
jgi:Protein of unknown function (DUF3631)